MGKVNIDFPEEVRVSGNPDIMLLGNPKRKPGRPKKRKKARKKVRRTTAKRKTTKKRTTKRKRRVSTATRAKISRGLKRAARKKKAAYAAPKRRRRKVTHAVTVRPRKTKKYRRKPKSRKVARTGHIQSVVVRTGAPATKKGRAKTVRINKSRRRKYKRNPAGLPGQLIEYGKDAGWVLVGLAGSRLLSKFIPRIPFVGNLPFMNNEIVQSAIPPVVLLATKKLIPLKGTPYNLVVTGSVANLLFKALGKVPVISQFLTGFDEDAIMLIDDELGGYPDLLDSGDFADVIEDTLSQEELPDTFDDDELGDVFEVDEEEGDDDLGDVYDVEDDEEDLGDVYEIEE